MIESQKNSDKKKSSLKEILSKPLIKVDNKVAQYSGLGLTLTVTILIFFWAGKWIDGKAGTTIVFTLIMTFIGFAAGFYSFYLNIKKLTEEDKKKNPKYNKF